LPVSSSAKEGEPRHSSGAAMTWKSASVRSSIRNTSPEKRLSIPGIYRCRGFGCEIVAEAPRPLPLEKHPKHSPAQGPFDGDWLSPRSQNHTKRAKGWTTVVTGPAVVPISNKKAIPDVGFVFGIFQGSCFRIRQGLYPGNPRRPPYLAPPGHGTVAKASEVAACTGSVRRHEATTR
jgi:hypothetical protein